MKNQIEWINGNEGSLPLELHERGLNLKGFRAVMFYISSTIAMLSMVWAFVISIRILQVSQKQTLPGYFVPTAMICIFVSVFCIKTFYSLYTNKRKYRKDIVISDGSVDYKEVTEKGVNEWKIKIRKFQEIALRHYSYRGVNSWYIALIHQDKDKMIPLFVPDYDNRNASEEVKRDLLSKYGELLGIKTNYYQLEEQVEKK